MKQYTTPQQTARLIELGLPKPKGLADAEPSSGKWLREAYSIGELIEMLPSTLSLNDEECEFHLMLFDDSLYWHVRYADGDDFCYPSQAIELIDALYDMVIVLKRQGIMTND